MRKWSHRKTSRPWAAHVALLVLAVLLPLLSACDLNGGEPEVVVVTATATEVQVPQQIVVTATFTPVPPTDTPAPTEIPPTADVEATVQAALEATMAAAPTDTEVPPTLTPTDTPLPPTDTPIPPTRTPKPQKPKATNTPQPATYAPPALMSPPADFSCYNLGGCLFTWAGGNLAANHYYQVQLVGPNNEHRGIHPPTKGYSFQSSWSVYQIIPDWCDTKKMCHMRWTVAIVEWDGKDPSKIGRTITQAEPRWVWL
jgi:hypothetical protein